MIHILQKTVALLFLFGCVSSLAEVQYKPIASVEKHNFYYGGIFDKTVITEQEKTFVGNSLKYKFIIPGINHFLGKTYEDLFKLSLGVGGHLFKKTYAGNPLECESSEGFKNLIYYGGLHGALTYFEYLAPFFEMGLARSRCFSYKDKKNISFKKPSSDFKSYMSVGLFLSFKLADKISIYSLDKDYGINDMGILGQCSWFYKKKKSEIKKSKKIVFCEIGLSITL